jgi:hypothetical protein
METNISAAYICMHECNPAILVGGEVEWIGAAPSKTCLRDHPKEIVPYKLLPRVAAALAEVVRENVCACSISAKQMDPKGKVALITGGARIGRVVAHCLAARGCDPSLIYRVSREAAEASSKAAISAGVRVVTIRADATNGDQIAAAVKETHRTFGRIDILLNMASTYLHTPNPNQADWSDSIDANARSVFLFSTYVTPIMKQGGGGRIINFADWLSASGRPRYRGG